MLFGGCFAGVTPMPGPSEGHPAEQRGRGGVLPLPITPRYDLSANNSFYRLGLNNSYSCAHSLDVEIGRVVESGLKVVHRPRGPGDPPGAPPPNLHRPPHGWGCHPHLRVSDLVLVAAVGKGCSGKVGAKGAFLQVWQLPWIFSSSFQPPKMW